MLLFGFLRTSRSFFNVLLLIVGFPWCFCSAFSSLWSGMKTGNIGGSDAMYDFVYQILFHTLSFFHAVHEDIYFAVHKNAGHCF